MDMTYRDLTEQERKRLKRDITAIVILMALVVIGAAYLLVPGYDDVPLPKGSFLDGSNASDAAMDSPDDGIDGIKPVPEDMPGPDQGLLDGYDNVIDPDKTMEEVCHIYLNNRTNSCGNFSGGGGGYPATQTPVPIPEFPMHVIPAFAGLLGLYMRRRPALR